ncbi:ParB/RepB/Spo0J family partition protein [Hydrogenovibrio halophilus]|uniref:ParB/RepB/Spo0J family partition protein n=1 Tax=Hydrogenovibrio halophilus TaxID=373391 RepID=UPI00039F45A8|nr:ParB/RepB/Spo0J family partition protein [Hydrogenovibrio halophilus]
MAKKRTGMGKRGVNALIGGRQKAQSSLHDLRVDKIEIDFLVPGAYQPRHQFDDLAMQELADSIRIQGIVQPIVVKPLEDGRYEIIAGERRWRAARMAGLEKVPVVVRQADNQTTLAMALIENMQRQDLNPIETAYGLKRLMQEFELTQQAVADAVGRSRTAVTNLLRLLKLPEKVQELLHHGKLSMGHTRAIITLPEDMQMNMARKAVDKGWSVREMEQAVQKLLVPGKKPPRREAVTLSEPLQNYQRSLEQKAGTAVNIAQSQKGSGRIEIRFKNEKELEALLRRLV